MGWGTDVCYVCGKRLYSPERCPRCGLTFCEEHLPPEKHNCIAVSQEKGERRIRMFSAVEIIAFLAVALLIWLLVHG